MAGAVPGVFTGIPFQGAAQVRAAPGRGGQELTSASKPFTTSWRWSMVLDGENTSCQGFSFPCTKSLRSMAAAIEVVMPHLLKPVATYRPEVEAE